MPRKLDGMVQPVMWPPVADTAPHPECLCSWGARVEAGKTVVQAVKFSNASCPVRHQRKPE